MTKKQALNIALKNAGATRSQVYDVEVEKDYEWGKWIYEISFSKGRLEYDYDIAVKGGKILHKDIEYDD
ncbi:MAG: PepSY domain-containing protein [Clostridiales Family XIII bacterium]|nr:PepSY domain-containing protein [Clostridiales Family XIII bacterium]